MTKSKVIRDLILGDFALTLHAEIRMGERGASVGDISACGRSAKLIVEQPDGTLRIDGFDRDGDKLTLICAYDGDTLIITVF